MLYRFWWYTISIWCLFLGSCYRSVRRKNNLNPIFPARRSDQYFNFYRYPLLHRKKSQWIYIICYHWDDYFTSFIMPFSELKQAPSMDKEKVVRSNTPLVKLLLMLNAFCDILVEVLVRNVCLYFNALLIRFITCRNHPCKLSKLKLKTNHKNKNVILSQWDSNPQTLKTKPAP